VVENLMKIAGAQLIGGGMAYTFLKSTGIGIGKSLVRRPNRTGSKNSGGT